jgi:hypothetical protein
MFPTVWQYLGYIGNWLCFFFFGFLSIVVVTTEHSYRTMRQNIITGLSRQQYFLSKFYLIVVVSLLAALLCPVWFYHRVPEHGSHLLA